jgi:uncharacterized membrane protein
VAAASKFQAVATFPMKPAPSAPIDASGQQDAHLPRVAMEFLNFLLILWAAWLLWRRPEHERFAFRLLVISCVLMALLFLIGTHGSLVPGLNL